MADITIMLLVDLRFIFLGFAEYSACANRLSMLISVCDTLTGAGRRDLFRGSVIWDKPVQGYGV